MEKENLEIKAGKIEIREQVRSKEYRDNIEFNPQYKIQEEYFDSLKCRCSCAPSPGPYCR